MPAAFRCLITVTAVSARLEGPEEAVTLAADALTVVNPAAARSPAGKAGHWDGVVRFLRRPRNTFGAGLTKRVSDVLTAGGFDVEWVQAPIPIFQPLGPPLRIEWRDYQTAAVDRFFLKRRLILQAPTGSGKTNIGIEVARRRGGRVLWIVHTQQLQRQTLKELHEKLPMVGVGTVGDGHYDFSGPITLGIINSLASLAATSPELFAEFDLLIEDEAHHSGAETWVRVANACTGACLRLGLSGTAISVRDPVRVMRMEAALGPIVVLVDAPTLIKQGHLARPIIRFLRPPAASYPSYERVRDLVLPDWRRDPRR